jgi:hypothetical protein
VGHRLVRLDEQASQQRPLARRTELEQAAVPLDCERSQDAELQRFSRDRALPGRFRSPLDAFRIMAHRQPKGDL